MAEADDLIRGANAWRDFLAAKGVKNPSSYRCDILYQSNGEAPDPDSPYPEEDVDQFFNDKEQTEDV